MKKDVSRNARHNERKTPILHILVKSKKYLRPKDIAKLAGITKGNARSQRSKLYRQGYIYRRKTNVGYLYHKVKNMGHRVACKYKTPRN
jgi:predicted DNA-binding transcriptional regulator